jgi:hypothetical protein
MKTHEIPSVSDLFDPDRIAKFDKPISVNLLTGDYSLGTMPGLMRVVFHFNEAEYTTLKGDTKEKSGFYKSGDEYVYPM